MNSMQNLESSQTVREQVCQPAVSIFLPFDPKMTSRSEITQSIKRAIAEAELQLQENYPPDLKHLVMEKLWNITDHLNFGTHKKSIAIYVSPVFEKVIYLNIPLDPKVLVGTSFAIRDIIHSKRISREYLVLVVSGKESGIYRGNEEKLTKILSHGSSTIHEAMHDAVARIPGADNNQRKERMLDKFLHMVDDSLGILMNAYHLPLFIMGPVKVTGHFKKLSRHANAVAGYVQGNYDDISLSGLQSILQPFLSRWNENRQQGFLLMLNNAADSKTLATGIREVWRAASNAKGRLLLLERDHMYTAQQGSSKPVIYMPAKPYSKFSPVKDAVDDIIEKVLESGGDVEFVDKNLLENYQHIALVQYY